MSPVAFISRLAIGGKRLASNLLLTANHSPLTTHSGFTVIELIIVLSIFVIGHNDQSALTDISYRLFYRSK